MKPAFYEMLVDHASEAARHARWIFTAVVVVSLIQALTAYGFSWGGKRAYIEDLVYSDGLPKKITPAAKAKMAAQPVSKVGSAALEEMRKAMVENWVGEQTFEIGFLGVKLDAGDSQQLGAVSVAVLMLWLVFAVRRENRLVRHTLDLVGSEPPEVRAHVFHGLATSRLFANLPDEDVAADPRKPAPPLGRAGRLVGIAILCVPVAALLFVAWVDYRSVFEQHAVFRGYPGSLWEMRGEVSDVFKRGMAIQAIALGAVLLAVVAIVHFQNDTCAWLDAARAKRWGAIVPEKAAA